MKIRASEFETRGEAVQWANADGRVVALTVDGMNLVTSQSEADKMQARGVEFAYLGEHKGQIVTVPVN